MRVPFAISNMAVIGLISQLYLSGQAERLQQLLQVSATMSGAFALAITAVTVMFPESSLSFLFGGTFSEGSGLLVVLAIGQLGVILTGSTQQVLLLGKGERVALLINVLGLAIIVATSAPAYQLFGRNGFAAAYSMTLLLVNLAQWYYVRFYLRIKTEPDVVKTFHVLKKQLVMLRKRMSGKLKVEHQCDSVKIP